MKKLILFAIVALTMSSCEIIDTTTEPEPPNTGTLLIWKRWDVPTTITIPAIGITASPLSTIYPPDCMSDWRWKYEVKAGIYDAIIDRDGDIFEKQVEIKEGFCTVINIYNIQEW